MSLPKPCLEPYCGETVTEFSRCKKHRSQREAKRRERRGKRPYDTKLWQQVIRPAQLRRSPLCEHCGDPASEVDHIDGDPTHHHPDNLQSLCRPCHSRKTHAEQHKSAG